MTNQVTPVPLASRALISLFLFNLLPKDENGDRKATVFHLSYSFPQECGKICAFAY